jgi:glycosyltransferase involved in cell wall biosynthesis
VFSRILRGNVFAHEFNDFNERSASTILMIFPMHIVQILPELNQGGVERGAVELNRELVKRGHQSTVISAGGSQAAEIEKDGGQHITLDVCSKNPLAFFPRVLALRRILRSLSSLTTSSQRPATPNHAPYGGMVLHARSRVPAWLCTFANKKLKLPFVTTVHGFNSVSKYSEIMTKGDRVIYGSNSIRDYVLKNYKVDESKLRYVPRGIDMDYFDPAKTDSRFVSEFKKKHGLENRIVVTIVGRITEWKGHETFIRALAEVQKNRTDVVGLVAGGVWHDKQEYFQALEKLAADLGADIRFVGSQPQVREIYALSNLTVSAASTKAETFGRAAAESLAMNVPVVASAQGGSLDIVLDGENGLFFEPENSRSLAKKIERAMASDFRNMRSSIAQRFSLDLMVDAELSVCRELLKRTSD